MSSDDKADAIAPAAGGGVYEDRKRRGVLPFPPPPCPAPAYMQAEAEELAKRVGQPMPESLIEGLVNADKYVKDGESITLGELKDRVERRRQMTPDDIDLANELLEYLINSSQGSTERHHVLAMARKFYDYCGGQTGEVLIDDDSSGEIMPERLKWWPSMRPLTDDEYRARGMTPPGTDDDGVPLDDVVRAHFKKPRKS